MTAVAALATSPPPDLRSSFRATYNLAVNLVRRYRADQAHFILDRSFAQFLDTPSPPRPVATPRPGPGAARPTSGTWTWTRGDSRRAGRSWRGSTTSRDLLVAEALAEGVFDGLDRTRAGGGGVGVHLRDSPGTRAAGRSPPPRAVRPRTGRRPGLHLARGPARRRGGAHLPPGAPARRRLRRRGVATGRVDSASSTSSSGPSSRPATSCATSSS